MKKAALFLIMVFVFLTVAKSQLKTAVKDDLSVEEIQKRFLNKKRLTAGSYLNIVNKIASPEQDCIAAIPLCDSVYTQTNSYVGQGNIPNEIDPTASCLLSGEKNDVWYTFTVQTGGNLNFSITPINGNDDYDWALFNLTNHICSDIFTTPSLEVSCNYAPNLGCGGVTGPNNNITGTCGGQNESDVPVLAGETYVINVSNFSSTQFGYTINFAASTATIYDATPPQPVVTGMNCTDSTFTISYPSELLDCSTISTDGSDFSVIDLFGNAHPVIAAAGIGCSVSQPYVSQVQITLHAADVPFPGFYLLTHAGSDGNTFSDKCGNFAGTMGSTDTVAFVNVLNSIQVNIGADTAVCVSDPKPLLQALNNGACFSWMLNGNPTGNNASTLQTTTAGAYIVTVTYGIGCSVSDTMNLDFLPSFRFNLGNDTSICQGFTLPVLHTGITNAISYQWYLNYSLINGANSDSLQINQPGNYIAVVDSGNASCPGTDTIQIAVVSPVPFDLGNPVVFCQGDSVLIKAGLAGGVSYQWFYNSNALPQTTDSIYANSQGIYYLEVSSAFNCVSMDSVQVNMELIAGKPKVNCPQNTGILNLYTWDPVPGATGYEVSLNGINNWTVPTSGTLGLSHHTPLSVASLFVRSLSGSFCPPGQVSESLPCEILISNILTTNDDGLNDTFYIKNIEQYPGTVVKIFNRWGIIIYNSINYDNSWDGENASDGVYFYQITFPGIGVKTGTLTLVK